MTYSKTRLLQIYREQMSPSFDPDSVTLIRWADRIETLSHFNVARRGWSYERAGTLADEVRELLRLWRLEMPTWVVETPQDNGTEISRHVQAPAYRQAVQLLE
jgi:hypothetical protein